MQCNVKKVSLLKYFYNDQIMWEKASKRINKSQKGKKTIRFKRFVHSIQYELQETDFLGISCIFVIFRSKTIEPNRSFSTSIWMLEMWKLSNGFSISIKLMNESILTYLACFGIGIGWWTDQALNQFISLGQLGSLLNLLGHLADDVGKSVSLHHLRNLYFLLLDPTSKKFWMNGVSACNHILL